jgi:hypothetical protein
MNKHLLRSPILLFALILVLIAFVTAIGPIEKTLGASARIVYLHGAWVWAALAAFFLSGFIGVVALIIRRHSLHRWSRALGRTGLFFWITYLPISMWAMQTSWNGLFLAEPRWRLAVVFGISGLLLQIGVTLLEKPIWASVVNSAYAVVLFLSLQLTTNVMHPPSPMLESDAVRIQLFFALLVGLTLLAAWQVARWWNCRELRSESSSDPQTLPC